MTRLLIKKVNYSALYLIAGLFWASSVSTMELGPTPFIQKLYESIPGLLEKHRKSVSASSLELNKNNSKKALTIALINLQQLSALKRALSYYILTEKQYVYEGFQDNKYDLEKVTIQEGPMMNINSSASWIPISAGVNHPAVVANFPNTKPGAYPVYLTIAKAERRAMELQLLYDLYKIGKIPSPASAVEGEDIFTYYDLVFDYIDKKVKLYDLFRLNSEKFGFPNYKKFVLVYASNSVRFTKTIPDEIKGTRALFKQMLINTPLLKEKLPISKQIIDCITDTNKQLILYNEHVDVTFAILNQKHNLNCDPSSTIQSGITTLKHRIAQLDLMIGYLNYDDEPVKLKDKIYDKQNKINKSNSFSAKTNEQEQADIFAQKLLEEIEKEKEQKNKPRTGKKSKPKKKQIPKPAEISKPISVKAPSGNKKGSKKKKVSTQPTSNQRLSSLTADSITTEAQKEPELERPISDTTFLLQPKDKKALEVPKQHQHKKKKVSDSVKSILKRKNNASDNEQVPESHNEAIPQPELFHPGLYVANDGAELYEAILPSGCYDITEVRDRNHNSSLNLRNLANEVGEKAQALVDDLVTIPTVINHYVAGDIAKIISQRNPFNNEMINYFYYRNGSIIKEHTKTTMIEDKK